MRYEMTYGCSGDKEGVRVASDASNTVFTALRDAASAAYWVSYRLHAPADSTYIMIPACAYDGNRFEAVHRQYPPMFTEEEFGLDVPVRMTEAPRLSREGDSFMDVTTGDMARSLPYCAHNHNRPARLSRRAVAHCHSSRKSVSRQRRSRHTNVAIS